MKCRSFTELLQTCSRKHRSPRSVSEVATVLEVQQNCLTCKCPRFLLQKFPESVTEVSQKSPLEMFQKYPCNITESQKCRKCHKRFLELLQKRHRSVREGSEKRYRIVTTVSRKCPRRVPEVFQNCNRSGTNLNRSVQEVNHKCHKCKRSF